MRRITTDSILVFVDKWPPFLIYAIARINNRKQSTRGRRAGLTIPEISGASGLSERTVERLSGKITWKNEKLKTIDDFARGCNFHFGRVHRQLIFIRENRNTIGKRFQHLSTLRWNSFVKKCAEYEKANPVQ